jgi:hypothetical protein
MPPARFNPGPIPYPYILLPALSSITPESPIIGDGSEAADKHNPIADKAIEAPSLQFDSVAAGASCDEAEKINIPINEIAKKFFIIPPEKIQIFK